MRRPSIFLPLLLAAALAGCSYSGPEACTDMAAPTGAGITVDADLAATLQTLSLKVCSGAGCEEHEVVLLPGATTVDQGCSGDTPDSVCSASSSPDGSLTGFMNMAALEPGSVEVSATGTLKAGAPLPVSTIRAAASVVYPNGRQCPGSGTQVHLRLGAAGLRAALPLPGGG